MQTSSRDEVDYVMRLACQIASDRSSEYVETEHVLMALIPYPVIVMLLKRFNVETNAIQRRIDTLSPRGSSIIIQGMSEKPILKHVRKYAVQQARQFMSEHVGVEHLFLGLLIVQDGKAFQVLNELGIKIPAVENAIRYVNAQVQLTER